MILGLAGLASLLVYSIRRHKSDDYRGRYRWWLLAAMVWLVMSVDATTGIHELFRAAMTKVSGYQAPVGGQLWWIGCWGLIAGATIIRLLLDMRSCKAALCATLLATLAWIAGIGLQLGGARLSGFPVALLCETSKLLGNLLLLLGVTLYARHVILHAQGLLPNREAKPRRTKKANKKEAEPGPEETGGASAASKLAHAGEKRTDLPAASSVPAPHFTTAHAAKASAAVEPDESDDEEDYAEDEGDRGQRRGSKADRKRLRKQKSAERDW